MIIHYLQITKPGIIFGNLISVIGGFLLASKGQINFFLLFKTLLGITLIIASSCVFNNYIDRDIDRKMQRTKNRVLAKELISKKASLAYATILNLIGIILLYFSVNLLAMCLAIIGFIIYVGIYSSYVKRKSVYGTLIGSLSGAIPPIIGYCTVSNRFDMGSLILFTIFSLWQMPHSYAIAILHIKDYQSASIPVLPIRYGVSVTKNHITLYIIAFIAATLMLPLTGYVGKKYLIINTLVNLLWLSLALKGYKRTNNDKLWARKLFIFSIVTITLLSVMISVDFTVYSDISFYM